MRRFMQLLITGMIFFMAALTGMACGQKNPGEVIVSEEEFVLRQDTDHSWVIDGRGKVRNIGDSDVKNVVVTGYCRSCGEILVSGKWFISDVEKTPEQKDVINYLARGAEESIDFREVAFLVDQSGKKPQNMPETLEMKVVSFETVPG